MPYPVSNNFSAARAGLEHPEQLLAQRLPDAILVDQVLDLLEASFSEAGFSSLSEVFHQDAYRLTSHPFVQLPDEYLRNAVWPNEGTVLFSQADVLAGLQVVGVGQVLDALIRLDRRFLEPYSDGRNQTGLALHHQSHPDDASRLRSVFASVLLYVGKKAPATLNLLAPETLNRLNALLHQNIVNNQDSGDLDIQLICDNILIRKNAAINRLSSVAYSFQQADAVYTNCPCIIYEVVQKNGEALKYASSSLRGNRDIVLPAVMKDGMALEYAGEELKKDRQIVCAAVRQNPLALALANKSCRNDPFIVSEAVKRNGHAIAFAGKALKENSTILQAAVEQSGLVLAYIVNNIDKRFADDRSIVGAAVKQNGSALLYASERLKNDPEILQMAKNANINAGYRIGADLSEQEREVYGVALTLLQMKAGARFG